MATVGAPQIPPRCLRGWQSCRGLKRRRSISDLRASTTCPLLHLWFAARRFWRHRSCELLHLQPFGESFVLAKSNFKRACDDVVAVAFQIAAVQFKALDQFPIEFGFNAVSLFADLFRNVCAHAITLSAGSFSGSSRRMPEPWAGATPKRVGRRSMPKTGVAPAHGPTPLSVPVRVFVSRLFGS